MRRMVSRGRQRPRFSRPGSEAVGRRSVCRGCGGGSQIGSRAGGHKCGESEGLGLYVIDAPGLLAAPPHNVPGRLHLAERGE